MAVKPDGKTGPVRQRPIKLPVEGPHPYTDASKNHIFIAMDFNPLTTAQMAELEAVVLKKYYDMTPHDPAKTMTFHGWVRIFP